MSFGIVIVILFHHLIATSFLHLYGQDTPCERTITSVIKHAFSADPAREARWRQTPSDHRSTLSHADKLALTTLLSKPYLTTQLSGRQATKYQTSLNTRNVHPPITQAQATFSENFYYRAGLAKPDLNTYHTTRHQKPTQLRPDFSKAG